MPKVATPLGWDVVLGIRIIGTPEPCGFVFDTTPGSARQVTLPRGGGLERCPDVGDCREANPGQENRAPQDDSPGLLRAPLTTATTKWHLAQRGIDTLKPLGPRAERKNDGDGPAGRNDPGRPPSALTPHERDQLLHDDLRTEPPADWSTSGGSIAEPCVAGLRPPAGREMACRTAPACRAVKSSSLSRW
jgi:hypothetical protein